GLARGVCATDYGHVDSLTELRFNLRRAVVDSPSFEILQIGELRFLVLCTCGNDDGTGGDGIPVVQHHLVGTAAAVELGDAVADHHLGAEFLRLRDCSL